MKIKLILITLSTLFVTSCGINGGAMEGAHTLVELRDGNFSYVQSVSAKASSSWIFGIGPLGKSALVGTAKKNLMRNANLSDSQTIANMTIDSKLTTYFGIFTIKTVYVTADVIEFK
tara:strand:- start:84 stop:434 length:351 start_codon:yes stop_codon:yes gene_type:complete